MRVAALRQKREAARQLVRTRLAVQRHITRLKHRIVRVMATHGYIFTGTKSNWTIKHRSWLRHLQRDLRGMLQVVLATHLANLEYLFVPYRKLSSPRFHHV